MPYPGAALWLPDYLEAFGVRVQTIPGWEDRGKPGCSFRGFVAHHVGITGGGDAPGLRTCVHGRADLRNALCNVHTARSGLVSVVAANVAWHAGKGGWAGLKGNETVLGDEVEGTTGEDITSAQRAAVERTAAACLAGLRREAAYACQHAEWAPGRKVDNWALMRDPAGFRHAVAAHMTPEEDDVFEYRIVTVPPPDYIGGRLRQQTAVDHQGVLLGEFGSDVTVSIKANDDAVPVDAEVQVGGYGDPTKPQLLVLSFRSGRFDGKGKPVPVPEGNVGVVLSHPKR